MDSGDEPATAAIGLLEGHFTGQGLSMLDLNKATALGISLLNQLTLHLKILPHGTGTPI
ncbi:MAG: hypothetical protein IMZ61_07570 [Planctomycetes bacterium]|nr:hypothetical protein [Planctomycetota bacterium]